MIRRALMTIGVLTLFIPAAPAHATSAGTLVFSGFSTNPKNAGLHTMPATGGTETKLAGTQTAYRPRWAPDGSGVAYIHARSIRWINADGSNDHLLIGHNAMPAHHWHLSTIAWSPDGTQLLLPLYTYGYRLVRLYRVDVATKHFDVVLKGASKADWCPTGRIVAIKAGSIMTMDPDGSHRTVIASGDPDWIRWSPDGSMLTLQQSVRRSGDIFVMDADGSHLTNLTTSKAYDWSPSWSPDSTKIVWSRSATFQDPGDLFVMDADGSNRTRLTSTAHLDEYEPDWTA